MSCSRFTEESCGLLLDYAAGRLDEMRKIAVETHLRGCGECMGFLTRQAELWSALDVWEPEPVSLDFNRRLWHRIENAPALPWYRRLGESLHVWKPAVPLAAAAAVVVAGFLFDHRGVTPVAASGVVVSGVSVSSSEAEQAERALDDLQLLKQLDTAARPM